MKSLILLLESLSSIYVLFSKEKFQKQTKKLIYAVFRPGQANMILQIGGKVMKSSVDLLSERLLIL